MLPTFRPPKRPFQPIALLVLPHHWIKERTFAWIGRRRRLSKGDWALPGIEDICDHVVLVRLMPVRLAIISSARG